METKVFWGEDILSLSLPKGWKIQKVVNPKNVPPLIDIDLELRKALNNPIGSKGLKEIIKPQDKVAIVVDDISRPTPIYLLMPTLLKELEDIGINLDNIILITALGVHRAMTEEEMARKVGKETLNKVKWINHNCYQKEEQVYLGKTRRGTPVYINKHFLKADMKILVGTIEPHLQAGFGGGYKNILPGVAGVETIGRNHFLGASPKYFSMIGWNPEDNPMRQDMEEVGKMCGDRVFIINTVLNPDLKIAKIVAGDPVLAHREGIKLARDIYGVQLSSPADIVITSSHPLNLDLRQGVKCIANSLFAVKKEGLLIALMKADMGMGDFTVRKRRKLPSRRIVKVLTPLLLWFIKYFNILGIEVENRFNAYFALQAIRHSNILIYSPNLPADLTTKGGMVEIYNNLQECINRAVEIKGEKNEVLIFPQGGTTYPLI